MTMYFTEAPFSAFTRKRLTFTATLGRSLDRFSDLYTSRTGEVVYYGAYLDIGFHQRNIFFVSRALLNHQELGKAVVEELDKLYVEKIDEGRHQIMVKDWETFRDAKRTTTHRTCQPLIERTSFADLLFGTLRNRTPALTQSALIHLIGKASYQIQTVIEAKLQHRFERVYANYPELSPRAGDRAVRLED